MNKPEVDRREALTLAREALSEDGPPVVILGKTVIGEALIHACAANGIVVAGIFDSNIAKTKTKLAGREVIYSKRLRELFPDARIIIAAVTYYEPEQMLRSMGYAKIYSGATLLENFDPQPYRFTQDVDYVSYAIESYITRHKRYFDPDVLFLPSVDVVITERCSLRCRDCSNLMSYYRPPPGL